MTSEKRKMSIFTFSLCVTVCREVFVLRLGIVVRRETVEMDEGKRRFRLLY